MSPETKTGSEAEGYWRKIAQVRNCYCFIRDKDPDYFRERGVPDGFCGICGCCGKPGHSRHARTGPYSATWCDKCYDTSPSSKTALIALSSVMVALLAAFNKEIYILSAGWAGLVTIVLTIFWFPIWNLAKISKTIFSILTYRDTTKARMLCKELILPSSDLIPILIFLLPPICYVIFRAIFPN